MSKALHDHLDSIVGNVFATANHENEFGDERCLVATSSLGILSTMTEGYSGDQKHFDDVLQLAHQKLSELLSEIAITGKVADGIRQVSGEL